MDKTPFAGLTRLNPGEPLSTDGSSFTAINPTIIDRLLALGARLHRHDAHPALVTPSEPPVVAEGVGGGFIPSGVTALVTYTLIDSEGGETLPAPSIALTTPDGVVAPETIPEYTVEVAPGGTMLAGTYYYGLTLTDGTGGETTIGPVITVDIPAGSATNQVRFVGLADIVAGYPGAQGWRLYKGSQYNRMHFLASGNAALDTVLDDGTLCADCATTPPDSNTTAATNSIDITIPAHPINQATRVVAYRVYIGVGGDLSSPALLGQFAIATLGTLRNVLDLQMEPGAPPDVATAIGGAAKINPNTDILNFHWLPPVETHIDLPEGQRGDVRMTLDTGRIWVVLASEAFGPDQWVQAAGGGGSGAGHEIWDEGLLKGPQGILDFVGPGVTVTEDVGIGKLIVTIPGGGGGGGAPTYAGGTFTSAAGDQAIPDNNTYLESIVLPVADTAVIGTDTDYPKLFLWIQHAFISDLVVELVAPDNTIVQVLPGNFGQTNLGTGVGPLQRAYFHPYAPLAYTEILANNAVGEWMPSGDWAALMGKNISGSWQVRIRDIYGGDAGILKGWGIVFTSGVTAQPHNVPLLETQGLEWRQGHSAGPLKGRVFLRDQTSYGIDDTWSLSGVWPDPNYWIGEANMSTFQIISDALVPLDLTVKKFVYASFYSNPASEWWLDDFQATFRFDVVNLADWGSVSFGIKDASGNKFGMRVADNHAGIQVFEEYSGVENLPNFNVAGAPVVGANWLVIERVGGRFYFSLYTTDPLVAGNVPANTAEVSPGAAHGDTWARGLSNRFRPYLALAPNNVASVTYMGGGGFGLRLNYFNRVVKGFELWGWLSQEGFSKQVRPLLANDRPGTTYGLGESMFANVGVGGLVRWHRDGQYVRLSGWMTLGTQAQTTISPPRGIPKRWWPHEDVYIFVPYKVMEASGQAGEIWNINPTGQIIRVNAPVTANKEVTLDNISWLAKDYHA